MEKRFWNWRRKLKLKLWLINHNLSAIKKQTKLTTNKKPLRKSQNVVNMKTKLRRAMMMKTRLTMMSGIKWLHIKLIFKNKKKNQKKTKNNYCRKPLRYSLINNQRKKRTNSNKRLWLRQIMLTQRKIFIINSLKLNRNEWRKTPKPKLI